MVWSVSNMVTSSGARSPAPGCPVSGYGECHDSVSDDANAPAEQGPPEPESFRCQCKIDGNKHGVHGDVNRQMDVVPLAGPCCPFRPVWIVRIIHRAFLSATRETLQAATSARTEE